MRRCRLFLLAIVIIVCSILLERELCIFKTVKLPVCCFPVNSVYLSATNESTGMGVSFVVQQRVRCWKCPLNDRRAGPTCSKRFSLGTADEKSASANFCVMLPYSVSSCAEADPLCYEGGNSRKNDLTLCFCANIYNFHVDSTMRHHESNPSSSIDFLCNLQ